MNKRGWLGLSVSLAVMLLMGVGAGAEESGHSVVELGDDVYVPIGEPLDTLAPLATDPLGLVIGVDTIRQHTLGVDVLDVWACGVAESPTELVAELDQYIGPYFDYHSRGRYDPRFMARGYAGDDAGECQSHSQANASANANGALHITPGAGGFASPGMTCGFSPCGSDYYRDGSQRAGFIGQALGFHSTAAHEMGHMLSWPHSYTGSQTGYLGEYDNALDLMSGNYGKTEGSYGSYPEPYATAAINLYAAGWIDPEEVRVVAGSEATFDLVTGPASGVRMAVVRSGTLLYVMGARIPSTYDPIPEHWSGVEIYEVENCTVSEIECLFDMSKSPGFRRVKPYPAEPFDHSDSGAYDRPLAHVIRPGATTTVAGARVEVGATSGDRIRVTIDPPAGPTFSDTSGSVFMSDIEWLGASGITKGCNPPANTLFCPDDDVTRGQMAAFLHRALPNLTTGAATDFRDDNGSVFEADIEWLASAGVTRGCNPPVNDRFCPDEIVTRAQMAAFLHRALPGLVTGVATDFRDDDGDVFEADIEWLAATGVTKGCNPPANDRFCPADPVTRGAMAAFLHRALDG